MTIFFVVAVTTLFSALLMFQHFRRTHGRLVSTTGKNLHLNRGPSRRARAGRSAGIVAKRTDSINAPDSCSSPPGTRCASHARSAAPCAGRARRTAFRNDGDRDRPESRRAGTARWHADARVPPPDEHLPGTLQSLPFAVLLFDSRGHVSFANPVAEKLFGYSQGEFIGTSSNVLVPGLQDQLQYHAASLSLGVRIQSTASTQDRVARRRDGTELPVEITINSMSSGVERCAIVVVVDRSERCELQRNRQQLAHLTRVSTLGELAGSLAHELNQPLTAILSNAQAAQRFMAARPINLVEVQEILHDLVEDNRRASEVIRKIRALAKKGELEAVPLSIASVIEDVALLVHSDAIIRGIRVSLNIAPGLPAVRGDKVQLQQVVLNLLLNAFDALECRPAQDRVVVVKATHDGKGSTCIAVSDRGRGVADDMFDELFAPFVTSKRDGLGLGLSISRSIVDMHGGRIWAENNRDQGATFHVTLPAAATREGACTREQP